MFQKYSQKQIGIAAALAGVIILVTLVIIYSGAISKKLYDWKFTPRPETFTELYFNDSQKLPTIAFRGETGTFSFTIHNVEGVQTSYPYSVYFVNKNGSKIVFKKSTVVINNGDYKVITVPYKFSTGQTNGMVVVMLTSLNQQIDFLVPDNNN